MALRGALEAFVFPARPSWRLGGRVVPVTIFGSAVQVPTGGSAAAWIGPRLGAFGTVGGLVPDGFDEYLLIRAPEYEDGRLDDAAVVTAIASIAEQHTSTPELVWFAIWDGYGWATAVTLYSSGGRGPEARLVGLWRRQRSRSADRRRRRRIESGLAQTPHFDLPQRRYYLVHGPVAAAGDIESPGLFGLQAPDLWWPEGREWFVATDTDLDWTYVGGGQALIAELLARFPERTEIVPWDAPNSRFTTRDRG